MKNPRYNAQFVADWFVSRAKADGPGIEHEPLTFRKLNNLMYVAQGIYASVRGIPLFDGEICKGFNGPAVLYDIDGLMRNVAVKSDITEVKTKSRGDGAFLEMVYQEVGKLGEKKLAEKIKNNPLYRSIGIGDTIALDSIKLWSEIVFLMQKRDVRG